MKASMINIPYDPILHDLSPTPRNISAAGIVEQWLGRLYSHYKRLFISLSSDIFENKNVSEWTDAFHTEAFDMPELRLTFTGIFGKILLLEFSYNETLAIAKPLIGRK